MSGKGEILLIDKVSKVFKGDGIETHALKEIDIQFNEGEFISIIGPSGSGKSTLLSLIGTLDFPTKGLIKFGDVVVQELNSNQLADFRFHHIGFIFQQFHLIPTLTALENVLSPLIGRKVDYDRNERAKQALASVGLIDKANSLPSQLSGGQQQRVAIARAIVNEPKWLLADEPTGNLDSENGQIIFELLRTLNREKGCSVIFVTHDHELAKRADRIVEMKDGFILSDKKVNTYA